MVRIGTGIGKSRTGWMQERKTQDRRISDRKLQYRSMVCRKVGCRTDCRTVLVMYRIVPT